MKSSFRDLTTGVRYAVFADGVDTEQLLVLATCELRATLPIEACDSLHLPRMRHWMNKEVGSDICEAGTMSHWQSIGLSLPFTTSDSAGAQYLKAYG